MLTIYGVTRSRATRVIWLANELGIPYKQVPVIQANRLANPDAPDAPLHSRSAEYMKINPNGRIPAIDDDGLILFESLAINLYLARKHGGPLAAANLVEDGQIGMWSLWSAIEIEPHAILIQRDPKNAQAAIETLRKPFAVLDAALAKTGHPVGGRFTVADINLAECVRYASAAPALFEASPRVKAWLAACQARPAFKDMWAKREAEPA